MMITNKTLIFLSSLILICGLFLFSPLPVKADDASVDGARAVLVKLAGLSKKQAIQTEAAQKLLTGEMLRLKTPSFGKLTGTPDKVLLVQKNNAVGRFQLFGENNQITDVYFYLQYDNA